MQPKSRAAPKGVDQRPPSTPSRPSRRRRIAPRARPPLAAGRGRGLAPGLARALPDLRPGPVVEGLKRAGNELGGAGYPLTSANNVLVLGSDARTKGTKEPGAQKIGEPGARTRSC